jgi:hypothetical protein
VDLLLSPHNPFRPPDARWQRAAALLLAGNRQPSQTEDDSQTWLAWDFLKDLTACRTDADRDLLASRYPAVAGAHQVFAAAGSLRRAELEARLLASQADEVIAGRCGLTPEVVGAYHDLFYAVRPCLSAQGYITSMAIGPKVHFGLTAGDHDILLKLFGYFEGSKAIDLLLDYLANPPVVLACLTHLTDAELESLYAKLVLQAKILTLTAPAETADLAAAARVVALLCEGRLGWSEPPEAIQTAFPMPYDPPATSTLGPVASADAVPPAGAAEPAGDGGAAGGALHLQPSGDLARQGDPSQEAA